MSPEITPAAVHAFYILDSDHKEICKAVLTRDIATQISMKVLDRKASSIQIARFSKIVETLFRNFPQLSSEKCTFITDFLKIADYVAVQDFFTEILRLKNMNSFVFNFLTETDFAQHIIDTIIAEQSGENNLDLIVGLFKLIRIFAEYPLMKKVFQSESNIEKLFLNSMNDKNECVLKEQWETIDFICDKESAQQFIKLVHIARNELENINDTFPQHAEFCFNFLASMCYCNESRPLIGDMSGIIKKVFTTFKTHTIALNAATKLAVKLASIKGVDREIAGELVPFAAHIFTDKEEVMTVRAFAYKLLNEMKDVVKFTEKLIEDLAKDSVDMFNSMTRKLEMKYGGDAIERNQNDIIGSDLFRLMLFRV